MSVASAIGQATTLISFVVFAAVVWFAYGKGRSGRFERAARAPFDVPDEPAHAAGALAAPDAPPAATRDAVERAAPDAPTASTRDAARHATPDAAHGATVRP